MSSDPSALEAPPDPPLGRATRQWTRADQLVGSALIVLLIALFLPWFRGTARLGDGAVISRTATGPEAHGYLWAVLVLAIVALAVLVGGDAISRLPGNPPSAEQLLAITTGLALALTVLGAALKPDAGVSPGLQHMFGSLSVSVGWSYGGFIAAVAAAAALLTVFVTSGPLQAVSRTARVTRPAGAGS